MPEENLFAQGSETSEPLAARMRPRFLDEFVGQEHIIGPGRLLRRAIQADMLSSLIFYGPPGTGKTTLARVIANTTQSAFISLNAVLAGVKDVREAIEQAKNNREFHDRKTILFVDEVHRWNKAQQDALLPWVENGTVILIGATTHNPFFEVNSALVSRSRIFQLKSLGPDDLREIARRVLTDPVRGYGSLTVRIDDDALEHLISVADGDARGLLGALQLAVETSVDPFPPAGDTPIVIDRATAEDSIQKKAVLYDKEGDYHFDVISAFIKSIRGSDPDATLFWMAKMVHSGEDPRYIFRRMLISASEDIGLADPGALGVVEAAAAAFDRVGMPEGRFHLAQAALYLATCPKSNSTLGLFDAIAAIEAAADSEVPNHLRDANRDKKGFGHGDGYLYPHAYTDHWVAQSYLPDALKGRLFYQPSDQGYEESVQTRVNRLRELQLEAGLPDPADEILTYSESADRQVARWTARSDDTRLAMLSDLREQILELAGIARHHRVLLVGLRCSLVLWDVTRSAPEGLVVALMSDETRLEASRHRAESFDPLSKPILLPENGETLQWLQDSSKADPDPAEPLAGARFDRIILVDAAHGQPEIDALLDRVHALASSGAKLIVAQRLPRESQRLADLVSIEDSRLDTSLKDAEETLYKQSSRAALTLLESDITGSLAESAWEPQGTSTVDMTDSRTISTSDIEGWFGAGDNGHLGVAVAALGGDEVRNELRDLFKERVAGRSHAWRIRYVVATAKAQ